MTIEQNLERLSLLNTEINEKLADLGELKQKSTSIGGFNYAQDRVQTSPPNDAPYTSIIELIIEKQKEIDSLIDEFIDLVKAIDSHIYAILSQDQHDVFAMRIYKNMDWHKISNTLGYSESTAHRKFNEAISIVLAQDIDF